MGLQGRRLGLAGVALTLLIAPGSASAATITVDTGGDGMTGCTLRHALETANTNAPVAGCTADPGMGEFDTVKVPAGIPSPIQLNSSLIADAGSVVSGGFEIDGPGAAKLDVRGPASDRVLVVTSTGVASTISDLTISHGKANAASVGGAEGGGIQVSGAAELTLERVVVSGNTVTSSATGAGANVASGQGGGIVTNGPLHLDSSTVSGNSVTATAANGTSNSASAYGGGVKILDGFGGLLTLTRTTIDHNTASASMSGTSPSGFAEGGGIDITSSNVGENLTVDRSTISDNRALVDNIAGNTYGGGIFADTSPPNTITSSTIAGNEASLNGDGANLNAAQTTFKNTLVAAPLGDVSCTTRPGNSSTGFNLEAGGMSCPFTDTMTDQLGVADAGIAPLADNGGATRTRALLPGSPAIDKGQTAPEADDQRGVTPRPFDFPGLAPATGGNNGDIGSFELQPACAEQAQSVPGTTCPGPATAPGNPTSSTNPAGHTRKRKCKKKKKKKRSAAAAKKKCKKKAQKLPV